MVTPGLAWAFCPHSCDHLLGIKAKDTLQSSSPLKSGQGALFKNVLKELIYLASNYALCYAPTLAPLILQVLIIPKSGARESDLFSLNLIGHLSPRCGVQTKSIPFYLPIGLLQILKRDLTTSPLSYSSSREMKINNCRTREGRKYRGEQRRAVPS